MKTKRLFVLLLLITAFMLPMTIANGIDVVCGSPVDVSSTFICKLLLKEDVSEAPFGAQFDINFNPDLFEATNEGKGNIDLLLINPDLQVSSKDAGKKVVFLPADFNNPVVIKKGELASFKLKSKSISSSEDIYLTNLEISYGDPVKSVSNPTSVSATVEVKQSQQQPKICTKDQWVCLSDATRQQCNQEGTGYVGLGENCDVGKVCNEGICVPSPQAPAKNVDNVIAKISAILKADDGESSLSKIAAIASLLYNFFN